MQCYTNISCSRSIFIRMQWDLFKKLTNYLVYVLIWRSVKVMLISCDRIFVLKIDSMCSALSCLFFYDDILLFVNKVLQINYCINKEVRWFFNPRTTDASITIHMADLGQMWLKSKPVLYEIKCNFLYQI